MHEADFMEVVAQICEKDPRYAPDAYCFIREALEYAVKMHRKPSKGPERHVTGRELLEAAQAYARQEYGPMARTVLESWGIRATEDFGEIHV